MQFDAALAFMKRRATAEESQSRSFDGFCGCIETIAEQIAQPADTGAIVGFRKHRLRIEAGDEDFDAEVMGDETGGDANGAIGAEDDRRRRDACQQERRDDNARNEFSQDHASPPDQRPFCASPTEGSALTLTPGGGKSSSGTKKSDIRGTEGSTR